MNPRTHARRRRNGSSPTAAVAAALILWAPSCGPSILSPEDEHAQLLGRIRAAYSARFDARRPDFVMITTPLGAAALPGLKGEEYHILRSVLDAKKIPNQTWLRSDVFRQITPTNGRRSKEYWAYELPPGLARQWRGKTVLFVNFDTVGAPTAVRHPQSTEYGINVLILNDPIEIQTRRVFRI